MRKWINKIYKIKEESLLDWKGKKNTKEELLEFIFNNDLFLNDRNAIFYSLVEEDLKEVFERYNITDGEVFLREKTHLQGKEFLKIFKEVKEKNLWAAKIFIQERLLYFPIFFFDKKREPVIVESLEDEEEVIREAKKLNIFEEEDIKYFYEKISFDEIIDKSFNWSKKMWFSYIFIPIPFMIPWIRLPFASLTFAVIAFLFFIWYKVLVFLSFKVASKTILKRQQKFFASLE